MSAENAVGCGLATFVNGPVNGVESIYPGKWVKDVLVFEPPMNRAELLVLPAKNVGGTDVLRFRIPASMIEYA